MGTKRVKDKMTELFLGKNAPVIDDRTITLKSIIKKGLAPPPAKFSIWSSPLTPQPQMLGNNQYGDCVEETYLPNKGVI